MQPFWIAQSGGSFACCDGIYVSPRMRRWETERGNVTSRRRLFTRARPRRARLMPIEMEYNIRTRTDDGIFSESLRGRGKKKRQRRRVFGQIGFIYSAAYCLFAQVHASNARQNTVQLSGLHHKSHCQTRLVFHFIFLHSLISEQAPDFFILPSLLLMSFSFSPRTPPTGIFPITSESSHLWNLTHFLPADLVLFFFSPVPPNMPIRFRGRPKLHCEYKKEKKKNSTRTRLSKDALFLFLAARELATEMVSKESFKRGGLLRNASLGVTRTFALY